MEKIVTFTLWVIHDRKKWVRLKIHGKWMLKECKFKIMLRIEDLKSEGKEEI